MNIDAAIFQREGKYGFGGIIRNHLGGFVSSVSGVKEGVVSSEIAEGVAVKGVLSWLKLQGQRHYQVETDYLVLVQAIRRPEFMKSTFEGIVRDVKEMLSSWREVDLNFVKRSANRVAHQIARASRLYVDCVFSKRNFPADILYCVEADNA